MTRIIYIGAKKPHCGKTVYEILANLKNFGVGRILQRNMWNAKYSEPSYYKVCFCACSVAELVSENSLKFILLVLFIY